MCVRRVIAGLGVRAIRRQLPEFGACAGYSRFPGVFGIAPFQRVRGRPNPDGYRRGPTDNGSEKLRERVWSLAPRRSWPFPFLPFADTGCPALTGLQRDLDFPAPPTPILRGLDLIYPLFAPVPPNNSARQSSQDLPPGNAPGSASRQQHLPG